MLHTFKSYMLSIVKMQGFNKPTLAHTELSIEIQGVVQEYK